MTSVALAACAAVGVYLILTRDRASTGTHRVHLEQLRGRIHVLMLEAGLEGISPMQFLAASILVGVCAGVASGVIFGPGLSALLIGVLGATMPAMSWRSRRSRRREAAEDAWPRMLSELRVLTGAAGRPVPQALIEVGLNGPNELRDAFIAAQREWALTTDFKRMTAVLKERLADPTADLVVETLVIAVEVGGDLDTRLADLAEDRRQDQADRKDSLAKQSGAKFARLFVIIVPAGMALAGLSVGDGAAAYRTTSGQLLVSAGVTLIAMCWIWASRIMRLPKSIRVFDQ